MRLRCTTEAWLYRLAIRENSAASVTHCFGPHDHVSCDDRDAQRPGLRCRQHQPASRATVPGAPAIGQRARARHSHGRSATVARTRHTRRARCTMKPWLNVSEAAEYAECEPRHDLHGMRAGRTAKRARQRKTRHSNPAGMDRCLAGTTRAGRSRSPAHWRHAERSGVMNPRATTTERDQTRDTARALTEREVAEHAGTVSRHAACVEASREGAAFPAARAFRSVPAVRRG